MVPLTAAITAERTADENGTQEQVRKKPSYLSMRTGGNLLLLSGWRGWVPSPIPYLRQAGLSDGLRM